MSRWLKTYCIIKGCIFTILGKWLGVLLHLELFIITVDIFIITIIIIIIVS